MKPSAAYSRPLLLADAWVELGSEVVPVPPTRQPHAAPSFQFPSESDVGVRRVFEAHAQECLVIKYEDVVVEVGCVFFAE